MKGSEDKIQLIRRIQSSHRQLERSIFFFQRLPSGGLQAGQKTRYSEDEMRAPGVFGSGSMVDLINHVYACERSFLMLWQAPIYADGGSSLMLMNTSELTPYPAGTARELPLEQVLERFQSSYREVLARIENAPLEVLFSANPFNPASARTLAEDAAEATFRNYDRARDQIRQWQKARLGRSRTV